MKEYGIGDYLQKDGDVCKIDPFQVHSEELKHSGFSKENPITKKYIDETEEPSLEGLYQFLKKDRKEG